MILVFGGTTEGRRAVEVLEEAGSPYYYSTKTGGQAITLHYGKAISGAMNPEAMLAFCKERDIRLIVDAAHPFATQLHQTASRVCSRLQMPLVRYERIYPPRDPGITWIDDYAQIPKDVRSLLATTGVQSIGKLKGLESEGVRVIYRILNRESSIQLAHQQGATDEQLCFYEENALSHQSGENDVDADAILLKESGLSGGFTEKVEWARKRGMRIIAIRRPPLTADHGLQTTVNGPYGLRRAVERLLPGFYPLRSGLTTGTCATAAAVAVAMRLLRGEMPGEVPVLLPDGETISVPVGYADGYACCIKEAGDDPDVTNGIEIRATPLPSHRERGDLIPVPLGLENMEVYAGAGIGRFTLPGFDYPPGEAAINKAPRDMMRRNLERLSVANSPLSIVLSVPDGEETARRTFNPRLGIEGGISIIGVSGIVKPFSEEAFVTSIRKCMEVAKASCAGRVVINSGFRSEQYLKAYYPDLPPQAFVQYGNYIGETLRMAHELSIPNVTLGVMLGKAVKLAQGHLDTHSSRTVMDRDFVGKMLSEADCPASTGDITLARELWERLPAGKAEAFARVVTRHCHEHCAPLLPEGKLTILLIDDEGHIFPS